MMAVKPSSVLVAHTQISLHTADNLNPQQQGWDTHSSFPELLPDAPIDSFNTFPQSLPISKASCTLHLLTHSLTQLHLLYMNISFTLPFLFFFFFAGSVVMVTEMRTRQALCFLSCRKRLNWLVLVFGRFHSFSFLSILSFHTYLTWTSSTFFFFLTIQAFSEFLLSKNKV